MKYTWLGHASVRLEIGGEVLLIDPWLQGNPAFPDARRDEALDGATAIVLTHGHFDHAKEVPDLARDLGVPVYAIVDLAQMWEKQHGLNVVGFNKGGTVRIGDVAVTMVAASHSSAIFGEDGGTIYAGDPVGYMIEGEGRTIYVSGDTDVMADMGVLQDLHEPEIGILCAGGHFTMDMKRAAYAASRLFRFRTVIPVHYRTFPLLEQSAEPLRAALPDVRVLDPEVMEAVEL
ncbi:metal-dependent hydrolase [Hasllibacter sp. MH4015]|uniref:metal-dependent hydrolase n=1 Tax=Hasllibacter sp. MH4015 TaxID=2854029 RepID=UPI001CD1951B|nr:metal-dependent hydrolase [Hasllibacter sp. MH4015]